MNAKRLVLAGLVLVFIAATGYWATRHGAAAAPITFNAPRAGDVIGSTDEQDIRWTVDPEILRTYNHHYAGVHLNLVTADGSYVGEIGSYTLDESGALWTPRDTAGYFGWSDKLASGSYRVEATLVYAPAPVDCRQGTLELCEDPVYAPGDSERAARTVAMPKFLSSVFTIRIN